MRVVLYRECDFRGRKLLFDSSSVERISLTQHEGLRERNDEKKYAEITDTFGYVVRFLVFDSFIKDFPESLVKKFPEILKSFNEIL